MQTVREAHEQQRASPITVARTPLRNGETPPLTSGDRLTRAEFERRYEANSEIRKAELIEGVVYVASPVYLSHGEPHSRAIVWLGVYCAATPGLHLADNNSLQLDPDNEVQPDVSVWLDESAGGAVRATPKGVLIGAPELIVEVAASSAAHEPHAKLHIYRRNGAREYLVLSAYERETGWYTLQDEEYQLLLMSRLFSNHPIT